MKNKISILVAEDEADLLEITQFHLTNDGYEVITAQDGKEAFDKAVEQKPAMILLDIMMPKYNGIEVCEALRKRKDMNDIFILLVTALDDDEKQIEGLEKGADDYIIKPVNNKVLSSKIKSFLKRNPLSSKKKVLEIEGMTINPNSYTISYNNKEFVLTKKQFLIVYFLASQPNVLKSRTEIIENVWGKDFYIGGRTIDVHIRKIREKTNIKNIISHKGIGYQFETIKSK